MYLISVADVSRTDQPHGRALDRTHSDWVSMAGVHMMAWRTCLVGVVNSTALRSLLSHGSNNEMLTLILLIVVVLTVPPVVARRGTHPW